jgi:hypothetical protein
MTVSPSNIKVKFRLEKDGEVTAGSMSYSKA